MEVVDSEKDTLKFSVRIHSNICELTLVTQSRPGGKNCVLSLQSQLNFLSSVKSFSYLSRKCVVTCYMRLQWVFKLSLQFTNCWTQKHFFQTFFFWWKKCSLSSFSVSPRPSQAVGITWSPTVPLQSLSSLILVALCHLVCCPKECYYQAFWKIHTWSYKSLSLLS